MSVQNALKIIEKCRNQEEDQFKNLHSLEHMLDKAKDAGIPCSIDELRKAFRIDWDLRWLKQTR